MDSATAHRVFAERAIVLGCTGEESELWAEIAVRRGWNPSLDRNEFERQVLDYLVDLGLGETWPNDLRKVADSLREQGD